jgi:hypothetical protein
MQTLSSIGSYIQTAADYVGATCVTAYSTAKPYLEALVQRIEDIWATVLLPALQSFVAFSSTRFGLSVDVLALSVVPFALSRFPKNTAAQIALVGTGVLMVATSAFLFSGLPIPGIPAASII